MHTKEEPVRATGLFGGALPLNNADSAAKFIAFIGRDPAWT